MTLMEVIAKASANLEQRDYSLEFPIVLNTDDILPTLKQKSEGQPSSLLVNPLVGWDISPTDSKIIELEKKLCAELKTKLKGIDGLVKDDFLGTLNSYLEEIKGIVGVSMKVNTSGEGYTRVLIEKLGSCMGRSARGLVLESCVSLEIWSLVEAMIVNGIVEHNCYSRLVNKLLEKKRSGLVCLCIKHAMDFSTSDLLSMLKYFLSPTKAAYESMVDERKEWERQALSAVELASDGTLHWKLLVTAKEASILLMIAYDGFSSSELCLHHLLSSSNVDEVMLSPAFRKLNGREMMKLIQYLLKWLEKYDKFPQAGPCPNASSSLGLVACDWVPKLEDVVKCLSLVLDENFSTLVLHPEFRDELRPMEAVVKSLTAEGKSCSFVADVVEKLKIQIENAKKNEPFPIM